MVAQHPNAGFPHVDPLRVPGALPVEDAERARVVGAGQERREHQDGGAEGGKPSSARAGHDDRERRDRADPGAPRIGPRERGEKHPESKERAPPPPSLATDRDRAGEGGEEERLPAEGERMPDRPLDAIRKLGALRDESRERVDRGQAGRGEEHRNRAPRELLVPRVMGGDGDEQEQESLENPGPTRAGVEREEGDERQGGDPGDRRKIDRGANPRRPVRKKPEKNRERDAE